MRMVITVMTGRRICPGGYDGVAQHVGALDMGPATTSGDTHGICPECLAATRVALAAMRAQAAARKTLLAKVA